jgi:hypothetical protein
LIGFRKRLTESSSLYFPAEFDDKVAGPMGLDACLETDFYVDRPTAYADGDLDTKNTVFDLFFDSTNALYFFSS